MNLENTIPTTIMASVNDISFYECSSWECIYVHHWNWGHGQFYDIDQKVFGGSSFDINMKQWN